jgi:hypothetical protein
MVVQDGIKCSMCLYRSPVSSYVSNFDGLSSDFGMRQSAILIENEPLWKCDDDVFICDSHCLCCPCSWRIGNHNCHLHLNRLMGVFLPLFPQFWSCCSHWCRCWLVVLGFYSKLCSVAIVTLLHCEVQSVVGYVCWLRQTMAILAFCCWSSV